MAQMVAGRKVAEEAFRKQDAYRKHASAPAPFVISSIKKNISHLVKGAFSCFKSGVGKLAARKK